MSFIEALNNIMAIQERYLYREKSRDTSIEAARSVIPSMSETHEKVLSYAFDCGYGGFTDVEMANHFNCLTSHYRSRRAQLTECGYIVATKVRRRHPERGNNRDHIVWKHKDFLND